jgi:hypothetical protein
MTVLASVIALALATLVHHVHNAQFLGEYPNMPPWLSPLGVFAAWTAATVIGIAGYLAVRSGHSRAGIALLALYACYGLDGLVHYALAPVSAHSFAMNATIWLEAITAAFLLAALTLRRREPGK